MNYNKTSTKRRLNRADSKNTKIRNKVYITILKSIMVLIIIVGIIGISAGLGVVRGIIDTSPDISQLDVVPTGYSTTILSSDGEQIATLVSSGANRKYVTIDEIPKDLQHAFVAIEDSRFYEHNGIDLYGIARAAFVGVKDVLGGGNLSQGASTITQQLIKNNVLTTWTSETTLIERAQRKLQEQYLALKLEAQVQDKDWILENYLNTINLGANTLGVQAASQKYFGKDVSELTLSECAVIAGITKSPYSYNPIKFPEANAKRRVLVLDKMLEQNYITKDEYDEAIADDVYERISSHSDATSGTSFNSYFVDALIEDVLNDLIEKKGYSETQAHKALYQGGLTIISTQDTAIQKICDEEVNDLANYSTNPKYSFDLYFRVNKADGTTKTYTQYTMLSYYQKATGNNDFNILYDSEQAARDAIAAYQDIVIEEGETIVEGTENIVITLQPQVALTIMDQSTGEVKALVGGRGEKTGNRTWNRATDTTRQPGSTFKIIGCYAAALDSAGMSLASVQDDAPFTVGDKTYKNNNADMFYGLTTIREAITWSYNITALKTLDQIGIDLGYEYAEKFGISTLDADDKNLGLAIGGLTNGVTNLELTAAYATIANSGEYIEPSFYTQIYDHDGNLLMDNSTNERHTVIKETTAWLLTSAMEDVMTSGTGTGAYFGNTMAQAGKSGTTSSIRDMLFAGYTPYYTCVIWGGHDDNSKQNADLGYTRAIWKGIMERVHEDLPYRDFQQPDEIVSLEVCNKSGLKPLEDICIHHQTGSTVYTEYFDVKTVPTTTCDHHIALDICKSSGKVASSSCPTSDILRKVFIYNASTETQDADYVATDKFIDSICPHKGSSSGTPPEDDTSTEDNSENQENSNEDDD